MESLRHPNIVMFLGACTKSPGNLVIVLEYCKNNSLWALLQNHNIPLPWEKRVSIAIDIAKGMQYLHGFSTPVLHRDLKSLNILLDANLTPKIADFGWTRILAEKMTLKVGTFQWMAPEVIKTKSYTEKADIYSYGIILWEIASREAPYKTLNGYQVSVEVVERKLRPVVQSDWPRPFTSLMERCWADDHTTRPNFKEILAELRSIRQQMRRSLIEGGN
jgi:mitogen-activated protein kinase kinase kinase 9